MAKSKFKKLLIEAVDICRKYGFDITVEKVMEKWSEPHRYWHTPNHLFEMLEGIKELFKDKKITEEEYHILVIAAVFHDIVYDPKKGDNEEKSVDYMMSTFDPSILFDDPELYALTKDEPDIISDYKHFSDKVAEVIMDTKTHSSKDGLTKKFNKLDTAILDAPFIDMLDWENKIYKEYKWAGWKNYKKGRIKFLLGSIKNHTLNALNIKNLIDYVEKKVPKTGICYYEIDKLPNINKFKENNQKLNNLFDNVMIIIVYNSSNYDREKIKEYGIFSDGSNEFFALSEDVVAAFIGKQIGDITLVKDLQYMGKYNEKIEKDLSGKVEDFRTIYI